MSDGLPFNDWADFLDGVHRGMAHALSNRIAGLSGITDLLTDADEKPDPEFSHLMRMELEKLHDLNRALKLLARDSAGAAEPFSLNEILDDTMRVVSLLPQSRSTRFVCEPGDADPVRAERWLVRRAFFLALHAALVALENRKAVVTLSSGGDPVRSTISLTVRDAAGAPIAQSWQPGDSLGALVRQLGASLVVRDDSVTIELPTLAETRRRERAGGG